MTVAVLTVEEIVQSLKRSSLPTILVEGRDDMAVYGWLEGLDLPTTRSVMQCGGRDSLLQVFSRRSEFAATPCVFVADQDMWTFTGVPSGHEELVLTDGYSIENDLLHGSCVHRLLSRAEAEEFNALARELSRWFAFEVEECIAGRDWRVETHPNQVVPLGTRDFDPSCVDPRAFREPDPGLVADIRADFQRRFRGKCLLALYVRILHAPGRESRLNGRNILEICAKLDSTAGTRRLGKAVRSGLTHD